MGLQWTSDLATGIKEIDNQHQELFDRLNELIFAIGQGKGREETAKTLFFLEEYVEEHFGLEEKFMLEFEYPAYLHHKDQHSSFINDLKVLKKEFNLSGGTYFLSVQVQARLGDWLINHIGKADKELANFLIKKNKMT